MSQKETAIKAVKILVSKNQGFQELQGKEKANLMVAFAQRGMVLYGQAYDAVKCKKKIDFSDVSDIVNKLDSITVYEIKSTNRKMQKDFKNYFFDLTTAELLVAQSLKDKFKFAFVNTTTGTFLELTLNQVFAKAKSIYPKWAIRF